MTQMGLIYKSDLTKECLELLNTFICAARMLGYKVEENNYTILIYKPNGVIYRIDFWAHTVTLYIHEPDNNKEELQRPINEPEFYKRLLNYL